MMNRFGSPVFSFAGPFLILIGLFGLLHRQGSERWQCLPVVLVGTGLIVSRPVGRRNRRKRLLFTLRQTDQDQI